MLVLFAQRDWRKLLADPKLALDRENQAAVEWVDPLRPPASGAACYKAQCYFVKLAAEAGDTLVLPAGWMHYVLTRRAGLSSRQTVSGGGVGDVGIHTCVVCI